GALITGALVDRYPPRAVMLPGIALFALFTAALAFMTPSIPFMILLFSLAGFVSGTQTPVPYSMVIARWFDRNRGLALGLAIAGVGLGIVFVPKIAGMLIGQFGWRGAYV